MDRLGDNDIMKSKRDRAKIIKDNICCSIPGCDELITFFKGPSADLYCREHQLEGIPYGGYGRHGKEHTFHRSDVCQCCGQDINDDPRWNLAQDYVGHTLTNREIHEVKRRYNHGDHDMRKADEGNDSAENINPYCTFCHWVKTAINNDSR